jgi:HEPN domain-containing protein
MPSRLSRNPEILPALKATLRKLENDPEKTPDVLKLRGILLKKIDQLEELKRVQFESRN